MTKEYKAYQVLVNIYREVYSRLGREFLHSIFNEECRRVDASKGQATRPRPRLYNAGDLGMVTIPED